MASNVDKSDIERGTELWFANVVGLPSVGLDPASDCHHIKDRELVHMFGNKVKNKGYQLTSVKSKKVKVQIEELYGPIWQSHEGPSEEQIPESLARAVILEVCHLHPMNWAKYGEDSWKGRGKAKQVEDIIFYKEPSRKTYGSIVVRKLEAEVEEEEGEIRNLEEDYLEAQKKVSELQNQGKEQSAERMVFEFEVRRLTLMLQNEKKQKDHFIGMKQLWESSPNSEAQVENYIQQVVHAEDAVAIVQEQLDMAEARLCGLEKEDMDRAEGGEAGIEIVLKEKLANLDKKKDFLQKLRGQAHQPISFHPSCYIDEDLGVEEQITIAIQPCAFCKRGFLLHDVIVASCLCSYHPWNVVITNWIGDACTNQVCGKTFSKEWQRSMGLFNMADPFQAFLALTASQPTPKKKHLNLDVGGTGSNRKRNYQEREQKQYYDEDEC